MILYFLYYSQIYTIILLPTCNTTFSLPVGDDKSHALAHLCKRIIIINICKSKEFLALYMLVLTSFCAKLINFSLSTFLLIFGTRKIYGSIKMVFIDKLKTIVGRSAGGKVGNALATSNGAPPSFAQALSQAMAMTNKLFEEREWQCPCGHKFRAGGEWVACAPIYCEVPSCPNPKYYIDGPGRALLEANPSGVRLEAVDSSTSLPSSSKNEPKGPGGVGSRFR